MTKREKLLAEALRAVLEPGGRNSVYADAAAILARLDAEEDAKGAGDGTVFYTALQAAKAAAFADDPRWSLRPDRVLATLPAKLCAYKRVNYRGEMHAHRIARDQVLPPGRYWPAGALPAGVVALADIVPEPVQPVYGAGHGFSGDVWENAA